MVEQGFYSLFIHQKEELRNEKTTTTTTTTTTIAKEPMVELR